MPLVRISVPQGKPSGFRRAVSAGVHRAMVETINVPADDLFQVVTEHDPESLVVAPSYLGLNHTADAVIVNVTLRRGRTVEMKQAFYAHVAEHLARSPGLRKEDVIIVLVENEAADWSFGGGVAQYVP